MASKRMVPAWQDAEPAASSKDDVALKRADGPRGIKEKAEEWSTATINTVMKRKAKVESHADKKSVCSTWRVSGRNESVMGKQAPTIFKGDYDSLNKANRCWEKELKKNWIGGELTPGGRRFQPHDVSEASAEAIAEARRRGRENCRGLDQAYKIKRDEYKILKEAATDASDNKSAFETYLDERKIQSRGRQLSRKVTRKSLRDAAGGLRDLFGKKRIEEVHFE